MIQITSAIIFTIFTAIVVLFQLGLAIGMPWGSASMGGNFPGKYPPKMRIVAIVSSKQNAFGRRRQQIFLKIKIILIVGNTVPVVFGIDSIESIVQIAVDGSIYNTTKY